MMLKKITFTLFLSSLGLSCYAMTSTIKAPATRPRSVSDIEPITMTPKVPKLVRSLSMGSLADIAKAAETQKVASTTKAIFETPIKKSPSVMDMPDIMPQVVTRQQQTNSLAASKAQISTATPSAPGVNFTKPTQSLAYNVRPVAIKTTPEFDFFDDTPTSPDIGALANTSIKIKPNIKPPTTNGIDNSFSIYEPISDQIVMNDQILSNEVSGKFESFINKTAFKIIKKSIGITSARFAAEVNAADLIAEYLQDVLFDFSNLSKIPNIPQNNFYNNFRMEIQKLVNDIAKYNEMTVYNSPNEMLLLIKTINSFLDNNNLILFTIPMSVKLDQVLQAATACCDIITNKNKILTKINIPKAIITYFQPVIQNSNTLSHLGYTTNSIYAIYNPNGYMDTILQTWQVFQENTIDKTTDNYFYAAFLTFLLLFENSLAAAAVILNQTSGLYQINNPITIKMHNGSYQTDAITPAPTSLTMYDADSVPEISQIS